MAFFSVSEHFSSYNEQVMTRDDFSQHGLELFGSVWDDIGEKDAGGESSEHPHYPMAEHYTSE